MIRDILQKLFVSSNMLDPKGQRRTGVRLQCDLPIDCTQGTTAATGRVIDISEGGLRVEMASRLRPETEIGLRYVGPLEGQNVRRHVRCRVVWTQKVGDLYHVGAAFEDSAFTLASSWVLMTLRRLFRAVRLSDDRRHMRFPTDLTAALRLRRDAYADPHWGRLLDVSVGGALFVGHSAPALGTHVNLRINLEPFGALALDARVVRRPRPTRTLVQVGLRFEFLSDRMQQSLEDLVREQSTQWRIQAAGRAVPVRVPALA